MRWSYKTYTRRTLEVGQRVATAQGFKGVPHTGDVCTSLNLDGDKKRFDIVKVCCGWNYWLDDGNAYRRLVFIYVGYRSIFLERSTKWQEDLELMASIDFGICRDLMHKQSTSTWFSLDRQRCTEIVGARNGALDQWEKATSCFSQSRYMLTY